MKFFSFFLLFSFQITQADWEVNYMPSSAPEIVDIDTINGTLVGIGTNYNESLSNVRPGFIYTNDQGLNWTIRYFNETSGEFFLTGIKNINNDLYATAWASNGFCMRADDFKSLWEVVLYDHKVKGIQDIFQLDANNWFLSGWGDEYFQTGSLIKTTDAGTSWDIINNNVPYSLDKIHFYSNDIALAQSKNLNNGEHRLLKTKDGGISWEIVIESKDIGAVQFHNNGEVYFSNNNKLFRSNDQCESWEQISYINDGYIYEVYFIDGDNAIMEVLNSDSEPFYFFSEDGGVSWDNLGFDTGGNYVNVFKVLQKRLYGMGSSCLVISRPIDEITKIRELKTESYFLIDNVLILNDTYESSEIYELNGNRISSLKNTSKIDLTSFPSGIYFIDLYQRGTIQKKIKVIK